MSSKAKLLIFLAVVGMSSLCVLFLLPLFNQGTHVSTPAGTSQPTPQTTSGLPSDTPLTGSANRTSESPATSGSFIVTGTLVSGASSRPIAGTIHSRSKLSDDVLNHSCTGAFAVSISLPARVEFSAPRFFSRTFQLADASNTDLGLVSLTPDTTTQVVVVSEADLPVTGAQVQALDAPDGVFAGATPHVLGITNEDGELAIHLDRDTLISAQVNLMTSQCVACKYDTPSLRLTIGASPPTTIGVRDSISKTGISGVAVRFGLKSGHYIFRITNNEGLLDGTLPVGEYRASVSDLRIQTIATDGAPRNKIGQAEPGVTQEVPICVDTTTKIRWIDVVSAPTAWLEVRDASNGRPVSDAVWTKLQRSKKTNARAGAALMLPSSLPSIIGERELPGYFPASRIPIPLHSLRSIGNTSDAVIVVWAPRYMPYTIETPLSVGVGDSCMVELSPARIRRFRLFVNDRTAFRHSITATEMCGGQTIPLFECRPSLDGTTPEFGWCGNDVVLSSFGAPLTTVASATLASTDVVDVVFPPLGSITVHTNKGSPLQITCARVGRNEVEEGLLYANSVTFEGLPNGDYLIGPRAHVAQQNFQLQALLDPFMTIASDSSAASECKAIPVSVHNGAKVRIEWNPDWELPDKITGLLRVAGVAPATLFIAPQVSAVWPPDLRTATRSRAASDGSIFVEHMDSWPIGWLVCLEIPDGGYVIIARENLSSEIHVGFSTVRLSIDPAVHSEADRLEISGIVNGWPGSPRWMIQTPSSELRSGSISIPSSATALRLLRRDGSLLCSLPLILAPGVTSDVSLPGAQPAK